MSHRQRRKESQRKGNKKRQQLTVFLVILGIGIIAAAIIIVPPLLAPRQPVVEATPIDRPNAIGNSMGDPDAPVKIEEYSDFQCPYCKVFADEFEPLIVSKYVATNKVYFSFIPYSFIGQESVDAANAAYCASDQGKFWEYKDILFANQTGENVGDFTKNRLFEFAEKIGLDQAQFSDCYNQGMHLDQVKKDVEDGKNKGISGTPSFLVNGENVSYSQLEETINNILSKSPPQ